LYRSTEDTFETVDLRLSELPVCKSTHIRWLSVEPIGVKLRFITEITKDNVGRCKDTMKIAELRHLEGVRGNFAVTRSILLLLLQV
jgi:hypothetical protein